MSQENVQIVKVAYDTFASRGLEPFMERFTADVEYRAVVGAPDDRGPIHGKEAVQAWLQDWIDMFDGFRMELVELVDAGEEMLVGAERYGGRAKLSGVDIDSTIWTVFTISDGKIGSGHEYSSREQALEAAGLRE